MTPDTAPSERDRRALREILRLCDVGARLVARGHDWFDADPDAVPHLAAESLIIKIGENVARLSTGTIDAHPDVPWPAMKRMRDRLARHDEGTDHEAVWDTLVHDLPTVRAYLVHIAPHGETCP